jgi:hypothetical protein
MSYSYSKTVTQKLSALAPHPRSGAGKRSVVIGEWITAERALGSDWNMCHEVFPDEKLMGRALEFSKTGTGQNQASLRLNKVLLNRWMFDSGNCS